jgi:hypothetical protein
MGRVNKEIEGVFTDIVGTDSELSSYDVFINNAPKAISKELKDYTSEYKKMIDKNRNTFENLSRLEEIVMQLRSKENVSDIKLSLVRQYIYARCSFYRKGKTAKDIRVIVDNVEFWEPNMESLSKNPEFMDRAMKKLVKTMESEILDNIEDYKYFNTKN